MDGIIGLIIGILVSLIGAVVGAAIINASSLDPLVKTLLSAADIVGFGSLIVGCLYGIFRGG